MQPRLIKSILFRWEMCKFTVFSVKLHEDLYKKFDSSTQ